MQTRRNAVATAMAIAVAGWVSSCSSSQPAPPAKDEALAPKPITAEERVKWYRDCWDYFNKKNWDTFKTCYSDNATSQQLGYGKPTVDGRDAIVASSQEFSKAFPDGHGEEELILVNGNRIASVHILKGSNTGPLVGAGGKEMPATNKSIGLAFGHAIDLDPAALKLVKEIGIMDGATFASQLGLSKAPVRPVATGAAPAGKVVIAKNDEAEQKVMATDMASYEAWNKHDAVAVDALTANEFVLHDVTQPKDLNKAQNSAMNKDFWKGFSDAKVSTPVLWAAGNYVVAIGTFEGTNDANFPPMKLKKTGKKVSLPFLQIDRVEDGRVQETWVFFDGAMFASQLGVGAGS